MKNNSQDSSQCCYSFQLSNGGIGSPQFDCLRGACSIYGVDLLKPGGNGAASVVLYSWKSSDSSGINLMREPITADNQWHELGTLCVPAFSNTEDREVVVSIKGQDGLTLCKQRVTYTGCTDVCGCDDFNKSVTVTRSDSLDKCCFDVSIDASKLKGGCDIRSVDVYNGAGLREKITPTYTLTTPVSKTFSGVLYTFCLNRDDGNTNGSREIVFRDATGAIICRKSVDLYCDCNCSTRPPKLKVEFKPGGRNDGKCCYTMSISAVTVCDFTLNNLVIDTDESMEITPDRNWTKTPAGNSHTLSPVKGGTRIGVNLPIGSICIAPCMAFDPHALKIKARVSMAGQEVDVECEVAVEISHGDDLNQCRGSKSCDDVVLSVVKPNSSTTPTLDDCCRKVRVQIRGCSLTNSSLVLDIKGPNDIPLKTTNLGGGIFESAPLCRTYRAGETFTVVVRDVHGNLNCTKSIPVPTSCTRQETNQ